MFVSPGQQYHDGHFCCRIFRLGSPGKGWRNGPEQPPYLKPHLQQLMIRAYSFSHYLAPEVVAVRMILE